MKNCKTMIVLTMMLASPFAIAQQSTGSGAGGQTPAAQQYKTAKLNRAQVDALLAKPGEIVVLDVRRPDELTSIGGFPVYLSIQTADVEKKLDYIPKDRRILTVSNHAVRAQRTGDLLEAKGFKVAGATGVQDYESEGGTLTKIAPRVPNAASAALPSAAVAAEKR
jgi:rhodanese-related sulfurtransferase